MLLKFSKEEENTYELVEPPISARRAAYIGEKEESASHHWKSLLLRGSAPKHPKMMPKTSRRLPETSKFLNLGTSKK